MMDIPIECLLMIVEKLDVYNSILLFVCQDLRKKLLGKTDSLYEIIFLYKRFSIRNSNKNWHKVWYENSGDDSELAKIMNCHHYNKTYDTFNYLNFVEDRYFKIDEHHLHSIYCMIPTPHAKMVMIESLKSVFNVGDLDILTELFAENDVWSQILYENYTSLLDSMIPLSDRHLQLLMMLERSFDSVKFGISNLHDVQSRILILKYQRDPSFVPTNTHMKAIEFLVIRKEWHTLRQIEKNRMNTLITAFRNVTNTGKFDFIIDAYYNNLIKYQQIANIAIQHKRIEFLELIKDNIHKLHSSTWKRAHETGCNDICDFLKLYSCPH